MKSILFLNVGLALGLALLSGVGCSKTKEENQNQIARHNDSESLTLISYLRSTRIPTEVQLLAEKGYNRLQQPSVQLKFEGLEWDDVGGGRSGDWIYQTFGQSEEQILKELRQIEGPETWSVADINRAFEGLVSNEAKLGSDKPTFYLVENVGINGLHLVPIGQDAIVQLASQFNYLESPGPFKVSVSSYLSDHTQGPMGAIEAAAASLHRLAAEESGKLPNALSQVLPTDNQKYYQDGYLMLGSLSDDQCQEILTSIDANIDQLHILPQWVLCERSGSTQLQVFSAAPSFQGARQPDKDACAGQIARKLVVSQYETIAKIAVIRHLLTGKPVPLHLTLVGQGVFNNPPQIMEEALNRVAEVVRGYNVSVYVHVFSSIARNKLLNELDNIEFIIEEMDREKFRSIK